MDSPIRAAPATVVPQPPTLPDLPDFHALYHELAAATGLSKASAGISSSEHQGLRNEANPDRALLDSPLWDDADFLTGIINFDELVNVNLVDASMASSPLAISPSPAATTPLTPVSLTAANSSASHLPPAPDVVPSQRSMSLPVGVSSMLMPAHRPITHHHELRHAPYPVVATSCAFPLTVSSDHARAFVPQRRATQPLTTPSSSIIYQPIARTPQPLLQMQQQFGLQTPLASHAPSLAPHTVPSHDFTLLRHTPDPTLNCHEPRPQPQLRIVTNINGQARSFLPTPVSARSTPALPPMPISPPRRRSSSSFIGLGTPGSAGAERIFACEMCPAAFRRSHDLKRHTRSLHTGLKPYGCMKCDKAFSRMDALKRHMSRAASACFVLNADDLIKPVHVDD